MLEGRSRDLKKKSVASIFQRTKSNGGIGGNGGGGGGSGHARNGASGGDGGVTSSSSGFSGDGYDERGFILEKSSLQLESGCKWSTRGGGFPSVQTSSGSYAPLESSCCNDARTELLPLWPARREQHDILTNGFVRRRKQEKKSTALCSSEFVKLNTSGLFRRKISHNCLEKTTKSLANQKEWASSFKAHRKNSLISNPCGDPVDSFF